MMLNTKYFKPLETHDLNDIQTNTLYYSKPNCDAIMKEPNVRVKDTFNFDIYNGQRLQCIRFSDGSVYTRVIESANYHNWKQNI